MTEKSFMQMVDDDVQNQMTVFAIQGLADLEVAYGLLKIVDEETYLKEKKELEDTLELYDE